MESSDKFDFNQSENEKSKILSSGGPEPASDYIETLYQKRMHLILERIFLALPKIDILACKNVSSSWTEIISSVLNSKNPRIEKYLNFRIEEEWKKKETYLENRKSKIQ